ncbi:hypothetical protein [Nocardia farcinica]|uniref:hypothetical protein n=1 Tax=Nocardia farcinica TaxID=37329 RepID=UPI0010C9C327|nr:hypothetical protein [Nocardia farcinica]
MRYADQGGVEGGQFGLGEIVGLSTGLDGVAGVGFELLAQLVPVGVAGPQPRIDLVSGADGAAGLAHGLLILHGHDRDLGADLGRGDPLLGEGLEQLRHPPAHFLAGVDHHGGVEQVDLAHVAPQVVDREPHLVAFGLGEVERGQVAVQLLEARGQGVAVVRGSWSRPLRS